MNKRGPLFVIDPHLFPILEEDFGSPQSVLTNWIRKISKRRMMIHLVGLTSFQEAHDYIFRGLLNNEYSDREDLHINLIKEEPLINNRSLYSISSIFSFASLQGELGNFLIHQNCVYQVPMVHFECDEHLVDEYLRRVSVNCDPISMDILFHFKYPMLISQTL